ncbi:MAG: hypothetical protein CVV27_09545 [Candidatus Melainabacteria bacterium HGW-Melainabacteria-1]|nr:MAG: hypothetical protein CVV27_09545 [Candidatus Melainabacteria bacterium HGW-Melainabacteria-1]
MKLEWLHYFVVLAESESFNLAADRLCISQQALSKHLAQIENRLGGQLIRRTQRFEKLTPAGELLLHKARGILRRAEQLESLFNLEPAPNKRLCLRLASTSFLEPKVLNLLRQILVEQALHPVLLQSLSAPEIEVRLQNAELEIGFLPAIPRGRRLGHQLFSDSPFVIVTAPGLQVQDWASLPYIRQLSPLPQADAWPEQNWPRRVVAEADPETALALCQRGVGALLTPRLIAEPYLRSAHLQLGPIPPFDLRFTSYLVWSEQNPRSPEINEFLQRLLQLRHHSESH